MSNVIGTQNIPNGTQVCNILEPLIVDPIYDFFFCMCYINLYSSNTNTKYMNAGKIGSTYMPRTRNEPRLGSAQGYTRYNIQT